MLLFKRSLCIKYSLPVIVKRSLCTKQPTCDSRSRSRTSPLFRSTCFAYSFHTCNTSNTFHASISRRVTRRFGLLSCWASPTHVAHVPSCQLYYSVLHQARFQLQLIQWCSNFPSLFLVYSVAVCAFAFRCESSQNGQMVAKLSNEADNYSDYAS